MNNRRQFLASTLVGTAAAGTLAAPSVVRAQDTFRWRMTNAYNPGAPLMHTGPGSPTDLAQRIETMSGGRLRIEHFGAGELVPAFEGFDAVVAGVVEANAANSYFWSGKTFASQYFTTVPFGMSFLGQVAWLYHGGGLELWEEVYEPFNIIAFPINNTGIQMTGWFREPVESLADFNGLRMRIPGLASQVYGEIGVDARVLPGGEIFPALERGVIDAAEFVGPYQDRQMGLHNAANYYYTTGWHEPATTGELAVSRNAWDALPDDLKAVVRSASQACMLESVAWSEAVNSEALADLIDNEGVIAQPLPESVVEGLREATADVLETHAERDPMVRKVHDAYMAFKAQHERWDAVSSGVWYRDIVQS